MKKSRIVLSIFTGLSLGLLVDFVTNGPMVFASQYSQPSWNSGLVGYWSFDGKNTVLNSTTTDLSGNNNTATLGSSSSTVADSADPTPIAGISGQALKFDGTDDYASVLYNSTLNPTSSITIETWVKCDILPSAMSSTYPGYFYNGAVAFYWYGSSNKLVWKWTDNTNTPHDWTLSSATAFTVNRWYYVVYTFDGTSAKGYINGVLEDTEDYVGYLKSSTMNNAIGRTDASNYFKGAVDEVKIYNRALSADEIKSHYAMTARKLRAASNDSVRWTNGLVGYWSFDGKYTTAATTTDQSGSGNTGTLANTTPVAGISGQALNFNGTTSYINAGNGASLNFATGSFSVETWVKKEAGVSDQYGGIFKGCGDQNKQNGWHLRFSATGAYVIFYGGDGSNNVFGLTASDAVQNGIWTQIVGVLDRDAGKAYIYRNGILVGTDSSILTTSISSSDSLTIARDWSSGHNFKGSIDEVRIYNRALSADEVKEHYELTQRKFVAATSNPDNSDDGLVGYWSFDGKYTILNSTTSDSSGNNNNATLGSTAGSDSYDPGTVAGISGQALNLNGTTTRVRVPSASSLNNFTNLTVSAWAKINNSGGSYWPIVEHFNSGYSGYDFWTQNSWTGYYYKMYFRYGAGAGSAYGTSSNTNIPFNTWNHLVITMSWDGNDETVKFYLNGVLDKTWVNTGQMVNVNDYTYIGYSAWNGLYFNGALDEVRIYNRALSAEEILQQFQTTKRNLKI